MEAKREAYMRTIGLHPDCLDLEVEVPAFVEALRTGLRVQDQGLEMLPCFLRPVLDPERSQELFLVMDAGGTHLRSALVSVGPQGERVLEVHKQPLPGTQEPIQAETFFDALAQTLLPWLDRSRKLGLCFSFAVEILPDREGVVAHLSKELRVSGLVGQKLGENLRAALRRLGDSGDLEVVVLNDTLAALLSVLPEVQAQGLEAPICMIQGTGFNLCYAEPRSWRAGVAPQLINTESGMHQTQVQGLADRLLDEQSQQPGAMRYEKMVSGAYLGKLGDLALRGAAGLEAEIHVEPLLSAALAGRLLERPCLTNQEISLFLADPSVGSLAELVETEEDRETMVELFQCLYARTAKALVLQIEGLLTHTDWGRERPAPLVVEGTTFYRSTGLRTCFEEQCRALALRTGRKVQLVPVREHSNLFGSALAWQTLIPECEEDQ